MYFQTRELPDTLDIYALSQYKPDSYPYALISTSSGISEESNSRFNIIFAYPQESLILNNQYQLEGTAPAFLEVKKGFLEALGQWCEAIRVPAGQVTDLPFKGGWFVYLSYELAVEIEPGLKFTNDNQKHPVAIATRCPAAIITDRVENKSFAVAETEYESLLDKIQKDISDISTEKYKSDKQPALLNVSKIIEDNGGTYLEKINRIKKFIYEGDIFQANLSRKWLVEIDNYKNVNDIDIFLLLSKANPASFSALIRINGSSIISSSPERLVRVVNDTVETRPIAGTRPRSLDGLLDESLANELLAHPKERAEHIMLIDLERNDLGRICVPGSIEVNEFMVLESYKHVHHIVSNVRGCLRSDVNPADVIRAVFPGGTITGCPKVHCMEILADLEKEARGAYTGSAGYINRDGSMDLNILIRTLVRDNNVITFRAGGGIVADSDPGHELEETRAKAKGLLNIFNYQDISCEPC